MGIYQVGKNLTKTKNAIDLHCGKCSIKCFGGLINTGD